MLRAEGYDCLKADFPYAGAQDGVRHSLMASSDRLLSLDQWGVDITRRLPTSAGATR
ncbi:MULTISPECIES: hypothetical protein [Streptomyces]|uniref:hypothetical protein n=1 Tax=Streptomyces TaxID=1883 RepID=UPI0029316261|nr:hypothetical protein [Streptomyces sp. NEAU-HV9]